MARKQDPIFRVIDFFETEPLPVARSAFSLVKRTLQKREAAETAPPIKLRRRRQMKRTPPTPPPPDAAAIALGATAPATPPAAPPTRPSRRRAARGTVAAEPAGTAGVAPGLALPGLGPSTIGD